MISQRPYRFMFNTPIASAMANTPVSAIRLLPEIRVTAPVAVGTGEASFMEVVISLRSLGQHHAAPEPEILAALPRCMRMRALFAFADASCPPVHVMLYGGIDIFAHVVSLMLTLTLRIG